MKFIQDLVNLTEGSKETNIKRLKDEYDNAMRWVNLPARDVADHIRSKWQQNAVKLARHAKTQYGIDLSQKLKEAISFEPNDIAIGGTVIYKTVADGRYKKSKARSVNDGRKMVSLENGDTVQLSAVVSTDASDWNAYKDKKDPLKQPKLREAKNHLGETTFASFPGWKRAVKQFHPDAWFDGDVDICNAFTGTKPYKRGETLGVGEWDGNEGVVFKGSVKESAHVNEDASELEVGDAVEITGNVEHQGEKGTIERFGSGKKFVVVKFEDGSNASFHSSDVSKADDMYDGEDDMDEEEDPDTFYVAFYDEDEERSWIGMVTREGGGKWHEKRYKGEEDYRWGQSYMSYLSAHDIMSWIHKDYRRGMDIEGPFFDAQEAEDYVTHNWGNLEKRTDESLEIRAGTSASELLKMVAEQNALKKNDSVHSSALGKALDKALSKQPKLSAVQVQRNKDRWTARQAAKDSTTNVEEAFKLKDKVKMIGGPKDVRGKEGHIAEIRTDVGGAKKYTIDYDVDGRTTSVMLNASDLRAVKE
jgi:transcription antitermination factor NusG